MIQSEKLLNYSLSLQPYITELTQTAEKVETMLRMIDSNPDGISMSSKNNSHKCSDKRLEKVSSAYLYNFLIHLYIQLEENMSSSGDHG